MDEETLEVVVDPPKAHGPKQELIMRAFQYPCVKEVFVVCGSKFGKSLGASVCLSSAALLKEGGKWRWLAPIYRQAAVGMSYFNKILPPAPYSEFQESKMRVKIPSIKSEIEFLHTQNPMDLEGPGIDGQVGDEAAKMPFQAYVSAKTTQMFTRGPSMWVSTPLGKKNWFSKKYLEARDMMLWAKKKGVDPTHLAIHAPTSANPFVSREAIEEARKTLPDRLFRQYYLAEFVDDGSVFLGVDDCTYGPEIEEDVWTHHEASEKEVVIGADWAKTRDYAVFIAIEVGTFKVVGFMRFHGISYVDAAKELYLFSQKFKSTLLVRHDKTGVGEVLDDLLSHFPINFEGFTFSNSSKGSIINLLGLGFEKKVLSIPNWGVLTKELGIYEVEVSESGNMKYSAPDGEHDDTVIALALAYSAANECSGELQVRFLEDLPKEKNLGAFDRYYQDMLIDSGEDSPF
jgi:hypothetical protein